MNGEVIWQASDSPLSLELHDLVILFFALRTGWELAATHLVHVDKNTWKSISGFKIVWFSTLRHRNAYFLTKMQFLNCRNILTRRHHVTRLFKKTKPVSAIYKFAPIYRFAPVRWQSCKSIFCVNFGPATVWPDGQTICSIFGQQRKFASR